jgi:hypothetical protein
VLKRGRSYIHSPDPDYEAKQAALLFLDQVSVYRQPTVGVAYEDVAYEQAGQCQPLARRGLAPLPA